MTQRLYYADSHLTEFDARVVSLTTLDDGRACVTLDRTAFYPTGGGQPTDTGRLDEARVVECIEREDEEIMHVIEGASPVVGEVVRGVVDWPRRLDHIQQHTGQHILSQAFVELFDAPTQSFRMLTDDAEIDVELRDPSDEKIERAIDRANEIVWADRTVRVHNLTPEEAARMPLRKDSEREGMLRIIEIDGFDLSPCGGTHAQRTGEVGIIAARRWERAKGLTRVTFVAGRRALADYRRANAAANAVAALFSTGRDAAFDSVSRLQDEHKRALRRLRELEEVASSVEARELVEDSTNETTPEGATLIARVFDERDAESLRKLALAIASHANSVALLGSREGDTARLVFARSEDARGDMNELMREACAALEGRGGGRPQMAQGGGRRADILPEVVRSAARSLLS